MVIHLSSDLDMLFSHIAPLGELCPGHDPHGSSWPSCRCDGRTPSWTLPSPCASRRTKL